jgi:TonB-linked SusC/RagA family outer membrane protein
MNHDIPHRKAPHFFAILSTILCGVFLLINTAAFARSTTGSGGLPDPVTIRGTVTDTAGNPIVGASVMEAGTQNGAYTDGQGAFHLEVSGPNAVLSISSIGYDQKEVPLAGKTTIVVTLTSSNTSLNEVVVVGYGTQKKATVTGAISEIKTADLTKNAVPDISNSIAGRLPGVIAVQSNAMPGEDAAQLFIRGKSTLNDNSPLILVDGVERPFNHIDPNTIESMSVLKDASATAVYGVRGANGVILITTKHGTESKPTVSYSAYYGIQNPIRVPHFLNSYDYARLYNEAQLNDDPSLSPDQLTYSPDDIQKYKDHSDPYGHPDVNWNKEIIKRNAPQQRHSLSLSGGSSTFKYFTSFGALYQDGIVPNVTYQSYDLMTNLDLDVTKTTHVSVHLSAIKQNRDLPGAGTYNQSGSAGIFSSIAPNAFPVKWENGTWGSQYGVQPVADLTESGYRRWKSNSYQSTLVIDQKLDFITRGLSVKALGSYDEGSSKEKDWLTPYKSYQKTANGYSEVGAGKKPSLDELFDESKNTTFELHLMYNRAFGKHNISGLLLYTQSASYEDGFSAGRSEYASSAIDQLFAGPNLNPTNDGSASESGREGYVGRVTYAYDSRYLFEANFGYNGSENFPPNHRFGFFPSASVGWIISDENFLKDVKVIDFLKLRASYGEVGNDKIGGRRFLYEQPFYFGSGYVLGGNSPVPVQSIYAGGLANTNVTWEVAKKSNIGIDAQLLNNLINFRADVFFEKRNNILATRNQSVPESFGAELPVENIAKVDNRGFEVELTHSNKIGKLSYTIGGNLTFAKNKIIYIDEPENIPVWQRRTGHPMGQYFGYVAEGLYLTQREVDTHPKFDYAEPRLGDIMYKDINGDGHITADDQTAIGYSRTPEIMYGINLSVGYRNFDLSALVQGAGKSSVYFSEEAAWEFLYGANSLETIKGRWTADGSNSDPTYPILSLYRNEYKKESSSYWLRNGAYWRLKNIELGYTLPQAFLNRVGISNLRVYIAGTNLYTHAKFKEWDPEAPDGNGTNYYPQMKVTNVGINVTF